MDTFVDYDMLCMWAIFKCVISNSIDMQLFLISQRKLRLDIFKMHEDHLLIWEGEGGGLTVIAPPPHHLTTDGTYNCSSLPYYFLLSRPHARRAQVGLFSCYQGFLVNC